MKYSEFVKQQMKHADIKKLSPKSRMQAIAKKWRSQKGKGIAHMTGGSMPSAPKKSSKKGGAGKTHTKQVYALRGGSLFDDLQPANQAGGAFLRKKDEKTLEDMGKFALGVGKFALPFLL